MPDPTFTFPAADATLDGSIQLFRWDLGDIPIESAWIYIGSTEGGSQHLSRWVGTGVATSAGELPIDGSAVFGRLWYRVGGTWNFLDRRWVAAASAGLPRLTEPTPGATLAGDTVTFEWDVADLEVESTWLYVGTGPGRSDIAGLPVGTANQVTVTGLPLDESTVHLRLFFRVGGIWYHIDDTYQAGTDDGPSRDDLIRELQALVGATPDGDIGPITRAALNRNWCGRSDAFDPSFAERLTNDDEIVRWTQRRLVAQGRSEVVEDGDFGAVTEAAAIAALARGGVVAAESFEALLDPAI